MTSQKILSCTETNMETFDQQKGHGAYGALSCTERQHCNYTNAKTEKTNTVKTLSEVCERNRPIHNSCLLHDWCKTFSNNLFTVTLFPPRAKWQVLSLLYLSCSASTVLSEIDTQIITNPYLKETTGNCQSLTICINAKSRS